MESKNHKEELERIDLPITGMSCASCAARIEKRRRKYQSQSDKRTGEVERGEGRERDEDIRITESAEDISLRLHEHDDLYEALMELDGDIVRVRPFSTILIKPGCRHRAVGRLRIVNICIPPFDPVDEWFD
jgi:hypothetical protein